MSCSELQYHPMMRKHISIFFILFFVSSISNVLGKGITPRDYLDRMEIEINGRFYTYYSFSTMKPVQVQVSGPGDLTVITRWLFPNGGDGQQEYSILITTDSGHAEEYIFSTKPSSKAKCKDTPDLVGLPEKITLSVPPGTHTYSFRVERPKGGVAAATIIMSTPWSWRLVASISNTYDDNIFRYSSEDIDDFVHHRAEYRYQMETYDDLIFSPSVKLYVSNQLSQHLRSQLRMRYSFNLFARNREKNYQTLSAYLKTTVCEKNYLQLGYFHLPEFLIRPYWDQDVFSTTARDPDTYKRCTFSRNLYSVKLGRKIVKSVWAATFYKRDILYYNPHFTEYDTKINGFGCEILYTVTPRFRIGLEYAFKNAKAKAYDEPGETRELSDDSDLSYDEDQFQGEIGLDLSQNISLPVHFSFQYRRQKRYFTTEKSLDQDPFHAGRADDIQRFVWIMNVDILRNVSLLGRYEFHRRDVSSKEQERITEVKNYERNRFSFGFEFRY